MTNEIIRLIKNYLNDFTIETTPNVYNKFMSLSDLNSFRLKFIKHVNESTEFRKFYYFRTL